MSITLCGRGCARFGARPVDGANSTNHSMVNQERLEPRRKPGIKLGHRHSSSLEAMMASREIGDDL
jgi:hypothetical protein